MEQIPGDTEGQESLECCSPRSGKESDNKIDFKNSKKRQIILLHNDKGSVHQEDTPIINIYAPIIAASKYIKQHLRRLKSKAIIIGDSDPFSSA